MKKDRAAAGAGAAMTAALVCSLLTQVSCGGCSLPFAGGGPDSLTILSYNVQNLFDDVSNGSEYYEYDPAGGEWTSALFHRKLLALSEVIIHAPRGGADILLLQEVENRNALETLRDHYLEGCGYRYLVITDAPDSAIQQACLSRFPLISVRTHEVFSDTLPDSRPVLECVADVEGAELVLMINHWKSKSGGARETEPLRMASAKLVRRRSAEILRRDGSADVVIAGDLNERTDEFRAADRAYITALMPRSEYSAAAETAGSMFLTGEAAEADGTVIFYSPWLDGEPAVAGTYFFRGRWEQIDHFLMGPALFDGEGADYGSCSVVAPDFILTPDGAPYGWSRTGGTGYSDHLPLLLRLSVNSE